METLTAQSVKPGAVVSSPEVLVGYLNRLEVGSRGLGPLDDAERMDSNGTLDPQELVGEKKSNLILP